MLLVFAHDGDWAARALVERWAAHDARLVTPRSLSAPGWSYRPGAIEESRLALDDEIVVAAEIAGVISRLPAVVPQDLPHIAADDQSYVAAEMNAFLVAWLTELRCPVVNRPTPFCLTGPAWRQERWIHVAARLGIPVVPYQRTTSVDGVTPLARGATPVSVVGDHCFGSADPLVIAWTRRLARAANVEALTAYVDASQAPARFVGAELLLALTAEIADALLARLTSGVRAA